MKSGLSQYQCRAPKLPSREMYNEEGLEKNGHGVLIPMAVELMAAKCSSTAERSNTVIAIHNGLRDFKQHKPIIS